jgi:hypothetical protein
MEPRATIFIEVMLVFAVIGVLAFLIGLIIRVPRRLPAGAAAQPEQTPRWYEFVLALILLAAIAAFAIWLISSTTQWVWGETIEDWRSDTRTIVFASIMVGLAVLGLVASLIYALLHAAPTARETRPTAVQAVAGEAAAVPAAAAAASPLRVLGLLALAVAVLLACWIALPATAQYGLIANLVYPAAFAVTLVLLFDKATRTWGAKGSAETLREWLLCDLFAFLLVVAFLNLRSVPKPDGYGGGTFWDLLNIVLFFTAFWLVDRSAARGRFLIGYGYPVVLPLLLLAWQATLGAAVAPSWWASVWPFLILSGVFFILEAITLLATTGERQALPAIKDAVFVVLYAVVLIVAAKSA